MPDPEVISVLKRKGYRIFTRPYELNLIGVRSPEVRSDAFDDGLYVLYKTDQGKWQFHLYRITTDPGTYWLNHPLQVEGTAILKEGQYLNAYQIGLHRGQYMALVQRKPVTIFRDYDRNAVLDFYNGRESTGLFGINIHRSSIYGTSLKVGKWSAGCQVFQNNADFIAFMGLCEHHRKRYGNAFTYTLIDFRAMQRGDKRRMAYAAGAVLTVPALLYLIYKSVSL